MSGFRRGVPNWKNPRAIKKIKELLDKHSNQKGVIHTSSNEQAFWIMDKLKDYPLVFVGGEDRNIVLKEFTESKENQILIGASIKDGVDFKGDLCRFQIVFKIPYPQLNEQVKYRRDLDPKWFFYQTVMALMQAYGRGIRDMDDWCVMYIIDSSFRQLFDYNRGFFNEYFTEAVQKKK
jgi:Rad3-related DNA helicase